MQYSIQHTSNFNLLKFFEHAMELPKWIICGFFAFKRQKRREHAKVVSKHLEFDSHSNLSVYMYVVVWMWIYFFASTCAANRFRLPSCCFWIGLFSVYFEHLYC